MSYLKQKTPLGSNYKQICVEGQLSLKTNDVIAVVSFHLVCAGFL